LAAGVLFARLVLSGGGRRKDGRCWRLNLFALLVNPLFFVGYPERSMMLLMVL